MTFNDLSHPIKTIGKEWFINISKDQELFYMKGIPLLSHLSPLNLANEVAIFFVNSDYEATYGPLQLRPTL